MDKIIELRDLGTSLGYKDEDLRQFIREQQAIQRDERKMARDKEKKEQALMLEQDKLAFDKDKLDKELKLKELSLQLEKEKLEKMCIVLLLVPIILLNRVPPKCHRLMRRVTRWIAISVGLSDTRQ